LLQEQECGEKSNLGFPQARRAEVSMRPRRCGLKRLYSTAFVKPLKNRKKSAFFVINSLYTYTRLSHPFARHVFGYTQKGEP
jgi:hypothetical protein